VSHVERRVQAGRVTYRARWRDPSGRERKRSFNRMTDARRFLVGVEDSKLRGAYVDPAKGKVVFDEWAERWFATTADLKPGTRRTYRMLLDNQVLPHFGAATWPASTPSPSASGWPASSRAASRPPASATPTRCFPRCLRQPSRAGG